MVAMSWWCLSLFFIAFVALTYGDGDSNDGDRSNANSSDANGSNANNSDENGSDANGSNANNSDANGSDGNGSDEQSPTIDTITTEYYCTKPGIMCSDCFTRASCVKTPKGFIQIKSPCASNEKCVRGRCSSWQQCNYRPFQCNDNGFFPDPYNCTKYYYCFQDPSSNLYDMSSFQCDEGSFDLASITCGLPLDTNECVNRPVPLCRKPFQVGALQSDPSTYYICSDDGTTLAPDLFKCDGGLIFDVNSKSCIL